MPRLGQTRTHRWVCKPTMRPRHTLGTQNRPGDTTSTRRWADRQSVVDGSNSQLCSVCRVRTVGDVSVIKMRRQQAHDPNTRPTSPKNHLAMPPQMRQEAGSGSVRLNNRLIGTPSVLSDAARIRDTGWRRRNSLFARANAGNGGARNVPAVLLCTNAKNT